MFKPQETAVKETAPTSPPAGELFGFSFEKSLLETTSDSEFRPHDETFWVQRFPEDFAMRLVLGRFQTHADCGRQRERGAGVLRQTWIGTI